MQTDTHASTPEELLLLLDRTELPYEIVEHEAVFTIAEALAATPEIGGIKTKNVFLRDAKGTRHFLVIVPHDVRLDLAALAQTLGSTKLSMGSPDRLQRHLGVTPGAVSVFALVQAHPLRNTATVAIARPALATFLASTGHAPKVIRV
jgi:Ala-tRNA(Pro) deacylase